MEYNKLIRDRIPEIIEASGKKYVIEKCNSPHEINQRLIEKLLEESDEFLESNEIEELADLLQIVHSLIENNDCDLREIEKIRTKKEVARGGFRKGIILKRVD
jgi:predicted house-cleaning noncanonical NTP pyrophosphatase (MazG superfamily)